MIEQATIDRLAAQGSWYFECRLGDRSDSVVITGDGIDDLDQLLRRIDGNSRLTMHLGIGFDTDAWKKADRADVEALKTAYLKRWGNQPKPPFWNKPYYTTPAFNVLTSIAGCQLWMDASQLTLADGAELTTFTDLSGPAPSRSTNPGHHATGVTTTRPIYSSTSSINGLPVVRFGADDRGFPHRMTTGWTVSGAFTIFLVEKALASVEFARTINNSGGLDTCINLAARNGGNNCFIGGTNVASYQATPLDSVHQGCLVATGSAMTYFVNGFQRGSVSASGSITGLGLGATSPDFPGEGANSDVCEIIFYDSALGTIDRQSVEAYLRRKWATPTQPSS